MFLRDFLKSLKRQHQIDAFLMLILSIIVIHKTGLSGIINKTDLHYPLYPIKEFFKSLFLWNDFITGFLDPSNVSKIWPRNLFATFLSQYLDVALVQRAYILLLLFGLSYSGYYLIYVILSSEKGRAQLHFNAIRLSSLIAGIFFLYNPFIFFHLNGGQLEYIYSLMGMNFTYAYLIRYMNSEKHNIKYLLLSACLLYTSPSPRDS